MREDEWTERELNPRPLPCQGSDLPLIYRPALLGCTGLHIYSALVAGMPKQNILVLISGIPMKYE